MSSTRVFICSGYNGSPSSQPRGSSLSSNIKEMSWYLRFDDFGRWYMGALKIYLLFGKWFQLLKLQRSFLQRFLFVWLSSDLCLKWQMSVHSNLRSDPIHVQTFQIPKAVDMRHFCCWHHLGNEKASKPEQTHLVLGDFLKYTKFIWQLFSFCSAITLLWRRILWSWGESEGT